MQEIASLWTTDGRILLFYASTEYPMLISGRSRNWSEP